MKKYLSLLGMLAMAGTSSLSVVACGDPNQATPSTPTPKPLPGTANIKQWSNQTSNIAKALILSKDGNFNTNRLLNTALNNNENNIMNQSDESTGSSYENFKNIWGYKKNIEGISEKDFNSDSAATSDNTQLATKNQISSTIEEIQGPLSIISEVPSSLITNSFLANLINGLAKNDVAEALWGIKASPEIITTIKSLVPMISNLVGNLDAFNPETVLAEDFKGNDKITESLFGENNDGWLNHYKTSTGFTSEAVKKQSSILNPKNFTSWDQVALFKSSVDLNGFIYDLSGQSLGELVDSSIVYDGNKAIDFDFNKFGSAFESIWSTTPENIINLIANLIPIVKYQLLELNPTSKLVKISTTEPTNKSEGIINLNEIITAIESILLDKDGFTKFISSIIFGNSETEFNLANYITFDLTTKTKKTLNETLFGIKDKVVNNLDKVFTDSIEPIMTQAYVKDIINKIKEDLANLSEDDGFELELTQLQGVLKILNDVWPFFDKIITYESKDAMLADWTNLWALLGLNSAPKAKDFIEGSVLAQFKKFITDNPDFLSNVSNLLDASNTFISDSFDVLINKQTTANVDFNNEKLWEVKNSEFIFDGSKDETTIFYNLINKNTNKTYKVTVVVQGKADQELGTGKSQVWLKSLSEVKSK